MKPARLTPSLCRDAERTIGRNDPVMRRLVRRHGACTIAGRDGRGDFTSIAQAVVSQQLSVKAADTIYRRLIALLPGGRMSQQAVLAVDAGTLRGAGLSWAKAGFLHDAARKTLDGTVPLDRLRHLEDAEVIASLTGIKGIGRWSAEMFLMFRLRRPDVFPLDDAGIVRAMRVGYGLKGKPTPRRLLGIAEAWRPYRTVACWYLWASLDNTPPAGR